MAVFTLVLTSCETQLDEVYDELDIDANAVVKELDYTLEDDDYEFVEKSFSNFNDEDEAKELVPKILSERFPYLAAGSNIKVTYHLYRPIRVNESLEFEMTSEDYDAIGERFDNLNSRGDIFKAADHFHPDPNEEDVVTIEYDYYENGETTSRESKLAYYNEAWHLSFVPEADDYYAMGQSFTNFDSRSTARARLEVYLNDQVYQYGEEGDLRTAVFTYTYKIDTDDDGETDKRIYEDFLVVFMHDGSSWVAIQDVVTAELQLGFDGEKWVPDNTIKYELQFEDWNAIALEFATKNPAGAESVASYRNFDVTLWNESQIFEAITGRLEDVFPNTEEGQKYLVSYATWEPGSGSRDLYVIYTNGAYEIYNPDQG